MMVYRDRKITLYVYICTENQAMYRIKLPDKTLRRLTGKPVEFLVVKLLPNPEDNKSIVSKLNLKN